MEKKSLDNRLLMAGVGGLVGATTSGKHPITGSNLSKKERLRNAVIGAGLGGVVGGYVFNKLASTPNKYIEKIAMSPSLKRVAVESLSKFKGASRPQLSAFMQKAKEGRGITDVVHKLGKPTTSLANPDMVQGLSKFHPEKVNRGIFSASENAKTALGAHARAQASGLGKAQDQLHAERVAARLARIRKAVGQA